MRASPGVPCGRKIMLYHPELFNEYEEVIIYPRREFKTNFLAIKDQINYSFLKNWQFEDAEEWQIMGYWLSILERVYMIEIDMNQFFSARASQSYLDSYLYDEVTGKSLESEVAESLSRVSAKPLGIDWL